MGPILWDLGYDEVLLTAVPHGATDYADDTVVVAGGSNWEEAQELAELSVAYVVRTIVSLGLRVSPSKTETTVFKDGRRGDPLPAGAGLEVAGIHVPIETQMKYLGLYLDGK